MNLQGNIQKRGLIGAICCMAILSLPAFEARAELSSALGVEEEKEVSRQDGLLRFFTRQMQERWDSKEIWTYYAKPKYKQRCKELISSMLSEAGGRIIAPIAHFGSVDDIKIPSASSKCKLTSQLYLDGTGQYRGRYYARGAANLYQVGPSWRFLLLTESSARLGETPAGQGYMYYVDSRVCGENFINVDFYSATAPVLDAVTQIGAADYITNFIGGEYKDSTIGIYIEEITKSTLRDPFSCTVQTK